MEMAGRVDGCSIVIVIELLLLVIGWEAMKIGTVMKSQIEDRLEGVFCPFLLK